MSEQIAKQIIRCVFKRIGKEEITDSEFYLTVSLQFQWCSPYQAKQFMHYAINESLLIKKGNLLSAGFNVNNVKIPVGFKPTLDFFKMFKSKQSSLDTLMKPDLFSYMTSKINCSVPEFEAFIDRIINEKKVSGSIALLLYAKKHKIQIEEYIPFIENEILTNIS
jgi:hypothetical protein